MTRARARELSLFTPPKRPRPLPPRESSVFVAVAVAGVGDPVTLPGVKKQHVRARCECEQTLMLGCLSCRMPLANGTQLLWHLEGAPDQTHVLARQCPDHGWEAI